MEVYFLWKGLGFTEVYKTRNILETEMELGV